MTTFKVDPEALILVQRNWSIYHTTWAKVEAGLLDDEDLVLIQRHNKIYHMRMGDYRTGTVSLGEYDFVWANLETQDRNEFEPPASSSSPTLELYVENIRKSWDGFDPQLVCPGNRIIPLTSNLGSNSRIIIRNDDSQFLPGKYMLVGQFDTIKFENSVNLTSVNVSEEIWNMMFWLYPGAQTDRRSHSATNLTGLGEKMFRNCTNLLNLTGVGVGENIRIEVGNSMFNECREFNADISGLALAKGPSSTAYDMLRECRKFNNGGESLNSMKIGGIKSLEGMFRNCYVFNQDISGWDMSKCENMASMFSDCYVFNQNIGGWIVKNVTNMSESIRSCESFDQDLGAWDVSNVTDMTGMFAYGYENGFNNGGSDSIKNWDTGKGIWIHVFRHAVQSAHWFVGHGCSPQP
jgi:surface protein